MSNTVRMFGFMPLKTNYYSNDVATFHTAFVFLAACAGLSPVKEKGIYFGLSTHLKEVVMLSDVMETDRECIGQGWCVLSRL